jgi:hypothetical protein
MFQCFCAPGEIAARTANLSKSVVRYRQRELNQSTVLLEMALFTLSEDFFEIDSAAHSTLYDKTRE